MLKKNMNLAKVPPFLNHLAYFVLILHISSFYSDNPVVCRKQKQDAQLGRNIEDGRIHDQHKKEEDRIPE